MHRVSVLPWAVLLFGFPAAAQDVSEEPARPAIEKVVREYILQHPEVLLESVRLYQERQRAEQQERAKEAVLARSTELQQDPSSPVVGPADGFTVVEFFGYRWVYCKLSEPSVVKLLAEHPDVRFVFKEFPILGLESSLASQSRPRGRQAGRVFEVS